MKKQALITIVIGVFLIGQPLSAQTWEATKRLTWNSGYSAVPAIAIDPNNHIHIVWHDNSPGNYEILYKRSTDGGALWTTKRLTWSTSSSQSPAISADSNSHIHVVWEDETPGNWEIFYKKSTDGGSNWTTQRLTWNTSSSQNPAIATDSNNHIHVIWQDSSTGNYDIYYKKSTDGGSSWITKRLTWTTGASSRPSIAIDSNNNIHIAWQDGSLSNPEIYYKKSTDGGTNWATKRLTYTPDDSHDPAIVADSNNHIHVVWYGWVSYNYVMYYKKSTDGGASWATKRLTWQPGGSYDPAIAADSSNNIHIVWAYESAPLFFDTFYKRSTDGGVSWTTKRLTYNPSGAGSTGISIDSSNNIHVVWTDDSPGNYEIFYKKGIQ